MPLNLLCPLQMENKHALWPDPDPCRAVGAWPGQFLYSGRADPCSAGGGAGKVNGTANSGTANTGGGGGSTNNADGGNGGSGIVIVRYAV